MFDRDASGNQNIAINTSSSKYEVPSESDTCLTITSAIGEDSGLYKCFYSAEPGVVMRTICVIVVGKYSLLNMSLLDSLMELYTVAFKIIYNYIFCTPVCLVLDFFMYTSSCNV